MAEPRVTYTEQQIQQFADHLRTLEEPKKTGHSKIETIHRLKDEIQTLRDRGFTLEQIAESLRGVGMDISTPTLSSYLLEINTRNKTKKARKKKKNPTAPAPKAPAPATTAPRVTADPRGHDRTRPPRRPTPTTGPTAPDDHDGMISPDAIRNL